jgi:hypothetical protein
VKKILHLPLVAATLPFLLLYVWASKKQRAQIPPHLRGKVASLHLILVVVWATSILGLITLQCNHGETGPFSSL